MMISGIRNRHLCRTTITVCGSPSYSYCTQESRYCSSPRVRSSNFKSLYIGSTIHRWASNNRRFLQSRSSPLEFYLHRSQYIRLLLSSHPPDTLSALCYAKASLSPFYEDHTIEFNRLLGCIVYLPLSRLQDSPYPDLASPSLHFDLEPLFAKEYCASLGMSRQVPLRVVGDIGGGGALARIEKGRKVMRERKSEWSQTDELPVCFLDATRFPALTWAAPDRNPPPSRE